MPTGSLATAAPSSALFLCPDVAWPTRRRYDDALLDYAVLIFGSFWTNASPAAFRRRAANENVCFINRNAAAAMRVARRVDECLRRVAKQEARAGARAKALAKRLKVAGLAAEVGRT